MSIELFLSGSGISKLEEEFRTFVGQKPTQTKVTLIPPVVDNQPINLAGSRFESRLAAEGFKVVTLHPKHHTPRSFEMAIKNSDLIVSAGGNPYLLLYLLKKLGADQYFSHYLNQGRKYVGASAGTSIMGSSIRFAEYHPDGGKNRVNLKNLDGFGFFPKSIWPHFISAHERLIQRYTAQTGIEAQPLKDGQALIIKDGVCEKISAPSNSVQPESLTKRLKHALAFVNTLPRTERAQFGVILNQDTTWAIRVSYHPNQFSEEQINAAKKIIDKWLPNIEGICQEMKGGI